MRTAFIVTAMVVFAQGIAGAEPPVGEAQTNWLAEIIDDVRTLNPGKMRQQKLQIKFKIEQNKDGAELSKSDNLKSAITHGLAKAKEIEADIRKNPTLKTASPHIQASWVIFDECNVKRPGVPDETKP